MPGVVEFFGFWDTELCQAFFLASAEFLVWVICQKVIDDLSVNCVLVCAYFLSHRRKWLVFREQESTVITDLVVFRNYSRLLAVQRARLCLLERILVCVVVNLVFPGLSSYVVLLVFA